jgi:Ala-tRNA(Pro) deacylase
MPVRKLKDFLDKHNIQYVTCIHSTAYTSQQIAASAHIPGKDLAKTVMVKLDGDMVMAVVPASYRIDLEKLKKIAKAKKAALADEAEFKNMFPDCEVGAMPPFGNLYDIPVYVSESLAEDEEIAFNAGSHRELIKMTYNDFERLVKPKKASFSIKTS